MRYIIAVLIFSLYFSSTTGQNLELTLQDIADQYGVMGMSVYVNVDGAVSDISIGIRDFERDLPVNEDTQYRIASISKSFTALGLVKLINDGAIGIDDDISEGMGYAIKNPNFPSTPITPRMLLSHTSGLQDGTGYGTFLSATYNQDPIPNISELVLPGGSYYTTNMWRLETPGTYFAYSNSNFGLIGTLIEALSQQRFDVFMKTEILEPLNINGSFNIQDLEDINNLSVLYRYNGGWNPQWDNYQGVMPAAPNLSDYLPGTNGVYFAPQGGLRTTASGINNLARAIASNDDLFNLNISEENYQLMKTVVWDYNGSNGDNYGGLFNRWSLGLHHANLSSSDAICPSFSESFIGHPGEAYGLVSDNYFIEGSTISFSLLINGVQQGYQIGTSAFYTIEEDIFSAICTHINQVLDVTQQQGTIFTLSPNPASNSVQIRLPSLSLTSEIFLLDISGKRLKKIDITETNQISFMVDKFDSGIYFIQLIDGSVTSTQKLIIE